MSLPRHHLYAITAYNVLLLAAMVAITPTTPGPQLTTFSPLVGGLIAVAVVLQLGSVAYFIVRADPPVGLGNSL